MKQLTKINRKNILLNGSQMFFWKYKETNFNAGETGSRLRKKTVDLDIKDACYNMIVLIRKFPVNFC